MSRAPPRRLAAPCGRSPARACGPPNSVLHVGYRTSFVFLTRNGLRARRHEQDGGMLSGDVGPATCAGSKAKHPAILPWRPAKPRTGRPTIRTPEAHRNGPLPFHVGKCRQRGDLLLPAGTAPEASQPPEPLLRLTLSKKSATFG